MIKHVIVWTLKKMSDEEKIKAPPNGGAFLRAPGNSKKIPEAQASGIFNYLRFKSL